MKKDSAIIGWRKLKSIRRQLKGQFRRTSQQVFKGRKEKAIRDSVKAYLQFARSLQKRFAEVMPNLEAVEADSLRYYSDFTELLIDQADRRLLKEEPILSEEKVYSIFEPHTEWITKGKSNPRVELGHNLLITTEQSNIIMDYKVMEKEKDTEQVRSLIERLKARYPHWSVFSHSMDKGFYSKENLDWLIETKGRNTLFYRNEGNYRKRKRP